MFPFCDEMFDDMMTCFGREFFGSETPPNVSVVTILDTFEPSSKMLISTW